MIHRLFLRQYWVRTLGSFHRVVDGLPGSQRTELPMGNYHRPPHVRCGHVWVIIHRHSEVGPNDLHVISFGHLVPPSTSGTVGVLNMPPYPPVVWGLVLNECLLARAAWLWINATYSILRRIPLVLLTLIGCVPLGSVSVDGSGFAVEIYRAGSIYSP